jgi:hypothetical protein
MADRDALVGSFVVDGMAFQTHETVLGTAANRPPPVLGLTPDAFNAGFQEG